MHFTHSNKTEDLITRVSDFMEDNIYPAEEIYASEMKSFREKGNPWHCLLYTSPSPRDY